MHGLSQNIAEFLIGRLVVTLRILPLESGGFNPGAHPPVARRRAASIMVWISSTERLLLVSCSSCFSNIWLVLKSPPRYWCRQRRGSIRGKWCNRPSLPFRCTIRRYAAAIAGLRRRIPSNGFVFTATTQDWIAFSSFHRPMADRCRPREQVG